MIERRIKRLFKSQLKRNKWIIEVLGPFSGIFKTFYPCVDNRLPGAAKAVQGRRFFLWEQKGVFCIGLFIGAAKEMLTMLAEDDKLPIRNNKPGLV